MSIEEISKLVKQLNDSDIKNISYLIERYQRGLISAKEFADHVIYLILDKTR
jgi:hypothetical protein